MAIALDLNCVCNRMLNEDIMAGLLDDYEVSIKGIYSIDNWMWDNEQKVESLSQVQELLNDRRIVIIQLNSTLFKDLGIYVEKVDNSYLYNLWINTEGYEMLDCDVITPQNSMFYEEIYNIISKIHMRENDFFKVVGIGLETDFCYSGDINHTIENSKNIIVWMIDSNFEVNDMLNCYKERKVDGLRMIVLEKIK